MFWKLERCKRGKSLISVILKMNIVKTNTYYKKLDVLYDTK